MDGVEEEAGMAWLEPCDLVAEEQMGTAAGEEGHRGRGVVSRTMEHKPQQEEPRRLGKREDEARMRS